MPRISLRVEIQTDDVSPDAPVRWRRVVERILATSLARQVYVEEMGTPTTGRGA